MKQRYRRGFSTAEKTELWDRWQREAASNFGKARETVKKKSPAFGVTWLM